MTAPHGIPFFANLPPAAVPAVQKLFDEVHRPGYNALAAYSNLVSRLNAAGTDVPARAVVKRFVAGVQCGQIARPVLPGEDHAVAAPVVTEPGYFESLPDFAMPALARLWDAVSAATGTSDEEDRDEKAFDAFFDEMRYVVHREPEWRAFVAFARAIRAGEVERPAKQIDTAIVDQAGESNIPSLAPETTTVVNSISEQPSPAEAGQQGAEAAPTVPAFMALRVAAAHLVEQLIVELSANVEKTARTAAARMLRDVADEMDGKAAMRRSVSA